MSQKKDDFDRLICLIKRKTTAMKKIITKQKFASRYVKKKKRKRKERREKERKKNEDFYLYKEIEIIKNCGIPFFPIIFTFISSFLIFLVGF